MHQPFGLMVPSTVWHAFGAVKSLQLLHICSPLGESWYLTTVCEILAARAGWLAASIVAAPLAHIAPPNKERLETCTVVILQTFVIIISLEPMANGDSRETLDPARTGALSATLENCREHADQIPVLKNCN
jgi:hypothetical protein